VSLQHRLIICATELFCESVRFNEIEIGKGIFEEVSLNQNSVLEESSTARVSLAPLLTNGSLLSQERDVMSRNKAKLK